MNELSIKTLRYKIVKYVRLVTSRLRNPDVTEHAGKYLWEIYVWQEISQYADRSLKAAWYAAEELGVVTKEEKLRDNVGSFSDAVSTNFVTSYRVDPPRMILDEDKLPQKISEKYGIDINDVNELIKDCKKPSKPALTRRVVERSFVT